MDYLVKLGTNLDQDLQEMKRSKGGSLLIFLFFKFLALICYILKHDSQTLLTYKTFRATSSSNRTESPSSTSSIDTSCFRFTELHRCVKAHLKLVYST